MTKMKPPHVPDEPLAVLRDDELRRLLATCERGTSFEDRRDAAIIRVSIDTGARRAEVAGLRFVPADEVRMTSSSTRASCVCSAKGGASGLSPSEPRRFEPWTGYVRMRQRSTHADLPWLWVGRKGRLIDSGRSVRGERGQRASSRCASAAVSRGPRVVLAARTCPGGTPKKIRRADAINIRVPIEDADGGLKAWRQQPAMNGDSRPVDVELPPRLACTHAYERTNRANEHELVGPLARAGAVGGGV